jgi:hypothetical protein
MRAIPKKKMQKLPATVPAAQANPQARRAEKLRPASDL